MNLLDFLLYIDPGMGSMAAQVIIAGVVAGLVYFRNFFRKLFFNRKDDDGPPGRPS